MIFLYFYTVFCIKMYHSGTPSSTLPFDMWVPISLVLVGGILVLLHSVCYVLLPKRYWHIQEPQKDDGNKEERGVMEVLLLFLIVFLGTSILFRMPVGFSIAWAVW